MEKENLKDCMWVCQSCLKKTLTDDKYKVADDYVNGDTCELCNKKSKHLTEIINGEYLERMVREL